MIRSHRHTITVIPGDGVGPEVVEAAQCVMMATGAPLIWEQCEAGKKVFQRGIASGVPQETIDSIIKNRVVLKGPLETPVGFGEKSANVTLRKLFETYGNIRPVREFPGVRTPFSGRGVDLVVVRENVEDLYAGIEHLQTPTVAQCLKLISEKGCEKIARLAFEVARAEGRKHVHCVTKSNIMKLTEGMLKRVFEAVSKDYPDIEAEHIIVDNCAHQLVRHPEQFEVLVTTNMNGDIISDLASGLIGGLGFAPSANLGNEVAIFEAVHGSAPKYAGQDVINPTALILAGALLLRFLNLLEEASAIEHAVLVTLASGVHTRDCVSENQIAVSTSAFTNAVIENLGRRFAQADVRAYQPLNLPHVTNEHVLSNMAHHRECGVDVFVESGGSPKPLGEHLTMLTEGLPLRLKMISNRGTKVYPSVGTTPDCIDHWRCRFVLNKDTPILSDEAIFTLLGRIGSHYRWMHIEKLPEFDGRVGFTHAQGEAEAD